MTLNDFILLSPDQKSLSLIFSGQLPSPSSEYRYKLYFYKKFYFEEVILLSTNSVIETNAVQKFAHFKKYLQAIRSEKLPH
jgi:hypothetical protein